LITIEGFTQDIHFSQFYASVITLNPSLTGKFDGDYRIMNIYRNQWRAISIPYITDALGFDKNFNVYKDKLSVGGVLIYDKSGPLAFTVARFQLLAAYHKNVFGNDLHVGYQFGYTMDQYDKNKLIVPSQWDFSIGQYNSTLPTNEGSKLSDNLSYIDMNYGFAWSRHFRGFDPTVGFSMFHFLKPKETFLVTNDLHSRQVTYVSANIDLTNKLFLVPDFLLMSEARVSNMVFGTRVGLKLPGNKIGAKAILAGVFVRDGIRNRNTDATAIVFGMNFKHLDVGISYDINISDLNVATNGRGAFEISLIYVGASTLLQKIAVPCDIQ